MKSSCQGVTLLELLIILAITGVLTMMAAPSLSKWQIRQEARNQAYQSMRIVQYARIRAVETGFPVIVCGSNTALKCTHNWNHGTLVFLDSNGNKKIEPDNELLIQYPPLSNTGNLTWKAAFGMKYFRALPSGRASFTGSFIYCPANADPRYASQVIINSSGRPRIAVDSDGDGIVENARGESLVCPP